MVSKLDDLLPSIVNAGDSGLSIGKITEKFVGKSKAKVKERSAELHEKLAKLVREGTVSGPLKFGRSQFYFATGHGPSIETASAVIVAVVFRSGVKLLSKAALKGKVTGINGRFFADGLKYAISSQAILELSCGKPKYYLHRDVAIDYFGFATAPSDKTTNLQQADSIETSPTPPRLTLENLLPAYRRLKAEQGGFSAVKIYDLIRALSGSKEDVHRLLIEETKAGRITIHPTTSVDLPKEIIDAGIRLPGFPEPFVTVVVKGEP